MGIYNSIKDGFFNCKNKYKIVIYIWAWNALFALVVVLPFYIFLKNNFSASLIGDDLLQGLDYLWVGDLVYKLKSLGTVFPFLILIPALFYLFSHIFINGGILGRLNDPSAKVTLKSFMADAGLYFGRFFRLFLYSIPVYLIFMGVLFGLFSGIVSVFTNNAATEWPLIITGNLKILVFAILFSIVNMYFDYVKIMLVQTESRKVIRTMWQTLKFIWGSFFSTLGLYLFIAVFHVIIALLYLEVSRMLPVGSTIFLMLIVFIWQQLYVIARSGVKLMFFASQMKFYNSSLSQPDEVVEQTDQVDQAVQT